MFNSLDASLYEESPSFYEGEFERILAKIHLSYLKIKKEKLPLENDENKIRDFILLKYLKNNSFRQEVNLLDFHFEREVQEDNTTGRTDIKIVSQNTFKNQDEYYIIECKRLDKTNPKGKTGLNTKYIENGIYRFTSSYYKSECRVNGMIGFIVDKLDIHSNVLNINVLLTSHFTECNTDKELTKDNFIEDFEYQYFSEHSTNDNKNIKLYHLMYDFHENISISGQKLNDKNTRKTSAN